MECAQGTLVTPRAHNIFLKNKTRQYMHGINDSNCYIIDCNSNDDEIHGNTSTVCREITEIQIILINNNMFSLFGSERTRYM